MSGRAATAVALSLVAIGIAILQFWPRSPPPDSARVPASPGKSNPLEVDAEGFVLPPMALWDSEGRPTVPIPNRAKLYEESDPVQLPADKIVVALNVCEVSLSKLREFFLEEFRKRDFKPEPRLQEMYRRVGFSVAKQRYKGDWGPIEEAIHAKLQTMAYEMLWRSPKGWVADLNMNAFDLEFMKDELAKTWPSERTAPSIFVLISFQKISLEAEVESDFWIEVMDEMHTFEERTSTSTKVEELHARIETEAEFALSSTEKEDRMAVAESLGRIYALSCLAPKGMQEPSGPNWKRLMAVWIGKGNPLTVYVRTPQERQAFREALKAVLKE